MADDTLGALGFTEHSYAHVTKCAETASWILRELERPERDCELAWIAGYLHDIGNLINREDHAISGAVMAFTLLSKMGMVPEETAKIAAAIGSHDEYDAARPVSDISAALILADKSDVRRSRVRTGANLSSDIHDRVNYAVESSEVTLDKSESALTLTLGIDTAICPVMEYFEIFLQRMLLSRKAAEYLGLVFRLVINGQRLL
ncbi:MAG: HD domain-containing protein [Oscillospiraceae bacterium]|nr:HD domain-containing protein [Oscillospiraceae bacterium]